MMRELNNGFNKMNIVELDVYCRLHNKVITKDKLRFTKKKSIKGIFVTSDDQYCVDKNGILERIAKRKEFI
jgi:hypothetical protein